MQSRPYFELNFRPNFTLVTVVRRFVGEFNRRFLSDADSARVALVAHELLENAVKFSADGATTIRMELDEETGEGVVVRVVLRNRASQRNIDAIQALVAGVAEAGDAAAFYQQLLVKRSRVKDKSGGLGIARICAEAEMELTCRVQGDAIEIEATTVLAKEGVTCSRS